MVGVQHETVGLDAFAAARFVDEHGREVIGLDVVNDRGDQLPTPHIDDRVQVSEHAAHASRQVDR
jgi:hypothetical protein